MPITWMVGYNVKEGKAGSWKEFVSSQKHKEICEVIEKKSGLKYIDTYFTIIPSSTEEGDYDAYDLWELPNLAAFDKARDTNALESLLRSQDEMVESRPVKMLLLRSAQDVKIIWERKKENRVSKA